MRRGQSALEFTLITTAMLILFAAGFIVIEQRFLDAQQQRLDELGYDVLGVLEAEIQIAWEAGDGYERRFFLPHTLSGLPYSLTFNPNQTSDGLDELVVHANNKEYIAFLPFDVEGTLQTGYMNVTGGVPVTLTPS